MPKYPYDGIVLAYLGEGTYTRKTDDVIIRTFRWSMTCAQCRKPFEFFQNAKDHDQPTLDLSRLIRRCRECCLADKSEAAA